MTTTQTRQEAIKKASKGEELGIIEAIKTHAVDIWAKDHKKFIATLFSLAGTALSLGLLHGTVQTIVTLILVASGSGAVKVLKNTKPEVIE